MKVLGIDTSTKTTSVGLIEDDKNLAEYNLTGRVSHSESVTNMIEEIFSKFDFELKDIDLIAVGAGPGSFTGLRIGITIAKVLALTLDKDIVAVSSLVANALNDRGIVATIVDAKRKNIYASIIKNEDDLEILMEDKMIGIEEFKDILKNYEDVTLSGMDAKNFLKDFENAKLSLNPYMSGTSIARLGMFKYKEKGADDKFKIEPNYLKLSQAEKQYEQQHKTCTS